MSDLEYLPDIEIRVKNLTDEQLEKELFIAEGMPDAATPLSQFWLDALRKESNARNA